MLLHDYGSVGWRRVALRCALLLLLATALGGCGSGSSGAAANQDPGSAPGTVSPPPVTPPPPPTTPPTPPPNPGRDVVTFKNDAARTGQYLTETALTLDNVNAGSFGKLRFLATDGKVDAQPLYLSALEIAGAKHNVVFVASERGTVYAFDADDGAVLWKVSLLGTGESASGPHACTQVYPVIGVTATPVIDRAAGPHGIIYVVAMSNHGVDVQRLHALDVTSGEELLGGPRDITAI